MQETSAFAPLGGAGVDFPFKGLHLAEHSGGTQADFLSIGSLYVMLYCFLYGCCMLLYRNYPNIP